VSSLASEGDAHVAHHQVMIEVHRYLETNAQFGKIVVTV
jgi:hypothetical protein